MEVVQPEITAGTISRAIAQQAAQWMVRLHDENPSAQDIQACTEWRQANPQHEQAWLRAKKIQDKLGVLPTSLSMKTLDRTVRSDRRKALKTLALLITVTPASYLAYRVAPLRSWSSDYSTAKGEQRKIQLADGSQLQMNTNTIVDVNFNDQQRFLVLHQGEILIETAKDRANLAGQPRPFIVQTSQGQLQPIGTRFVVRKMDDMPETQLSVLEGVVKISPDKSTDSVQVDAGQQVIFSAYKIKPLTLITPKIAAWSKGLFYAQNMRLDDFLIELGRYRSGVLRCDPEVAALRISGAFQLDNTQQILAMLPDTLPVSVQFTSPYWVTIKTR